LVLQGHFLDALIGNFLLAQWANSSGHHPDFNAVRVKVMGDVAGQRRYQAVLSEVYQAN